MTIVLAADGTIELSGQCAAEDAEILQRHLVASRKATVAWGACEHLHAAVLQILLAARPALRGSPSNVFLRTHIAPLLEQMQK